MKYVKAFFVFLITTLVAIFYIDHIFYRYYLLYGEEKGFLNYDYVNYRHSFLWNFSLGFGSITSDYLNLFTMGTVSKVAYFFHLVGQSAEKFLYVVIIQSTLLFAYLLFQKLSKNYLIGILLALLYITPYSYFSSLTTTPKMLHYLILPASTYFWLLYQETNKLRYIVATSLLLIFTLSIGINPPQMLGAYMFVFVYVLIFSLPRDSIKALYFLSPYVLALLYVLVNSFIAIKYSTEDNIFQVKWSATSSLLHEIYRFFGAWWDYAGHQGLPYNSLVGYYHSPVGIILTYIPFLIVLSLLYLVSASKLKGGLALILIFFLLMAKGSQPPFQDIFNALFSISIFKIFREPWAKFIPTIVFTVYTLIATLLPKIKSKRIILFALSIMLVFQSLPLLKNEVIDHRNIAWKKSDVQIPYYWYGLSDWSKLHGGDKRILVLPLSTDPLPISDWKPFFFAGYPEFFFLYSKVVNSFTLAADLKNFAPQSTEKVDPQLLTTYGIDYVLYKDDMAIKDDSLKKVWEGLDVDHKIIFGQLTLFPVKESYHRPLITILDTIKQVKNDCDSSQSTGFGSSTVLTEKSINSPLEQVPLRFDTISPVEYRLRFDKIPTKSIGLLFTEGYNKGWKLYKDDQPFSKPLLTEDAHLKANCFANLWVIPPHLFQNSNTLYLRFEPQIIFEKLQLIIIALLGLTFLLIWRNPPKSFSWSTVALFQKILNYTRARYLLIDRVVFLRLLILIIGVFIFIYSLLNVNLFSGVLFTLLLICWTLTAPSFHFTSRFSFGIALGVFQIAIIGRVLEIFLHPGSDYMFLAEKGAAMVFLLLISGIYSSFVVDHLAQQSPLELIRIRFKQDSALFAASNHPVAVKIRALFRYVTNTLIQTYKISSLPKLPKFPKFPTIGKFPTFQEWVVFIKRNPKLFRTARLVCFALIVVLVINNQLGIVRSRISQNPVIYFAEPQLAYRSTKIIVHGKNLGWKPNDDRLRLMNQYGEIEKDLWRHDNIIFTVPLHWKYGEITIWVEKPIEVNGKHVVAKSKPVVIKLIPTEQKTTPDNELFIEQLENLSDEALEINGYK